MKFVSARDHSLSNCFEDVVFAPLAKDGGLYMPESIPALDLSHLMTLQHIEPVACEIMAQYIDNIPAPELEAIIQKTFTFDIPLLQLTDDLFLLEVFHGPTNAFKDVGARFMANVLEYYLLKESKHLSILVATSGDTGSAIANAFHHKNNIDIYVLYPSGKISHLQEMQMTTLGGNVHALEVNGTFDDCQKLVKTALLDDEVQRLHAITTANSINLARLLPQSIYHAWSVIQAQQFTDQIPILAVPSGNFGNLVSALYAKRMGFPIQHFIAATNENNIVPEYLKTGKFQPRASVRTLSNAMDVGHPSNFERLSALYGHDLAAIQADISGIPISDAATVEEIKKVYEEYGVIVDPHTAVGIAAANLFKAKKPHPIIVTATAHPAKFPDVIRQAIDINPDMPNSLQQAIRGVKQSTFLEANYAAFKALLQSAKQ